MAKARARDTDGTQMETDNRADQRKRCTIHSLSLSVTFCPCLSLSHLKLRLSLSPSPSLLSPSTVVLIFFDSPLSLSLDSRPLLRSLSQALSLPPSRSLSFGSGSSPVFPHTVLSSVFMGRVLCRRHSPQPSTLSPSLPTHSPMDPGQSSTADWLYSTCIHRQWPLQLT